MKNFIFLSLSLLLFLVLPLAQPLETVYIDIGHSIEWEQSLPDIDLESISLIPSDLPDQIKPSWDNLETFTETYLSDTDQTDWRDQIPDISHTYITANFLNLVSHRSAKDKRPDLYFISHTRYTLLESEQSLPGRPEIHIVDSLHIV